MVLFFTAVRCMIRLTGTIIFSTCRTSLSLLFFVGCGQKASIEKFVQIKVEAIIVFFCLSNFTVNLKSAKTQNGRNDVKQLLCSHFRFVVLKSDCIRCLWREHTSFSRCLSLCLIIICLGNWPMTSNWLMRLTNFSDASQLSQHSLSLASSHAFYATCTKLV